MRRPRSPRTAPALLLCAVFLSLPPAGRAADLTTFELTDGSVVSGELVSIDSRGYTVRSPSLGTVQIDQSEVQVMRRGGPSDTAAGNAQTMGDIEAMQRRLVNDPQTMSMIMALQSDPALGAALGDPDLMRAISSGDIEAVRGNPRFRDLMDHPGIRAIIERVEDR